MKPSDLKDMALDQLIEAFKQWSFKQSAAVGDASNGYAQASSQLTAIGDELRRRGSEARRALLPLLNCTGVEAGVWRALSAGAQCRYNAASELLTVEPDLAFQALKKLAAPKIPYGGFLARMTLSCIDDGSFKPN